MCVIIRRNELPTNIFQRIFGITPKVKPIIAKKDIIVYKWYLQTEMSGVVQSPYFLDFYLIGKLLPKVEIKAEIDRWLGNTTEITEGYHSFVSETSVDDFKTTVQYKCVIPKGSKYYTNGTNIISDQLIVLIPNNNFLRTLSQKY